MKSKDKIQEVLETIVDEDEYANGARDALQWVIGELYDDEFVYYVEED